MSPSKFSSLASLITEQPLRLGSSKQDFAEVALRSLECLDSSPCFLGLLVTFPQVVLERGWGRKVVTDYCVDVGQFERVIGLHDGLGRGTSLEGMNHQFQEHATVADAKDPGGSSRSGTATVRGSKSTVVMASRPPFIESSFTIIAGFFAPASRKENKPRARLGRGER